MHLILPTNEIGKEFYNQTKFFCESKGLPEPSLDTCLEAVIKLTEESIFNRLNWTVSTDILDELFESTFPWWRRGCLLSENDPCCQEYFSIVVDSMILKVNGFIDNFVGHRGTDKAWKVWHVLELHGDLVLEEGTDYRILEWERRTSSGEWK